MLASSSHWARTAGRRWACRRHFQTATSSLPLPAPDSALVALAARLGQPDLPLAMVRQAMTDPSYAQRLAKDSGGHPSAENIFRAAPHNAPLASLGNALLGLYVSEVVHLKFPHAPPATIKKLVTSFSGTTALASLGRSWGLAQLVAWLRGDLRGAIAQESKNTQLGTGLDTRRAEAGFHEDVMADATRAMIATIYTHHAASSDPVQAVRDFVHTHLLNKDTSHLKTQINPPAPRRLLEAILRKYQRGPVTMRILKETGRGSNQALFVVGAFDGPAKASSLPLPTAGGLWARPNASGEKLGEDFGGSIKMAEHRAARNAIIRLWFSEQADAMLPSETMVRPHLAFLPTLPGETEALP